MSLKFNMCSVGDPADPKTWSGTPFNLLTEFKKLDVVSSSFSSSELSRSQRGILKLVSRLAYGNSVDQRRGRYYRKAYSNRVQRLTAESGSNKTLHFGTIDFSMSHYPADQKHFLYVDSTWNLWSKHVTNLHLYSDKLLKDVIDLEKESYEQVSHFFPISEYVKQDLIETYGIPAEKITPVGTGLGVIKPFYGDKDYSNKKILFTAKGRFEDKGGDLVISAFLKAYEKDPDIHLTIVGQDQYKDQFDYPNITTLGFIPLDDLQELFNTHSLFIMPARNEPWGLVYIEALLCKMPIIGLNRNSLPEITNNGKFGILIDDPDPELLAKQVVDLFGDVNKMEQMGTEGQQYVSDKYQWELAAKTIVETIKNLA